MSDHHAAVAEAIHAFAHRNNFDRQQKADVAISLAEWGVFSNRHIAAFLDMTPALVGQFTHKTDKTGGTLKPESLPHVLRVIELEHRGEVDHFAVKRALDAGCSSIMLARLTGRPQTSLSRHARIAARSAA